VCPPCLMSVVSTRGWALVRSLAVCREAVNQVAKDAGVSGKAGGGNKGGQIPRHQATGAVTQRLNHDTRVSVSFLVDVDKLGGPIIDGGTRSVGLRWRCGVQ